MKLLVGLGNPGKEYDFTRHNVGWLAIDHLFKTWKTDFSLTKWVNNDKLSAEISTGRIDRKKIILIKPQTWMNNSGLAIAKTANFYKIPPEDIIIIHDDIDLALGQLKIGIFQSSAGHKGIESTIQELSSNHFMRCRVGIGRSLIIPTEKYVLQPIPSNELDIIRSTIHKAEQQLLELIKEN